MGNYNPRAPYILGEEWVPIRDEDVTFSPFTSEIEVGHGFTLTTTRFPDLGAFYINDWPPGGSLGATANQLMAMSIYPRGFADQSGPVESVIIPCSSGGVTGNTYTAAQVASALLNPADADYLALPAATTCEVAMFFNAAPYVQLNGKRILGISFLYSLIAAAETSLDPAVTTLSMSIRNDLGLALGGQVQTYAQNLFGAQSITVDVNTSFVTPTEPRQIRLSGYTPFWTTAGFTGSFSGDTNMQFMPWTYPTLLKFDAASANRIHAQISKSGASAPLINLNYAALQVFYCEEQRVATTCWRVGTNLRPYVMGTNQLPTFRAATSPHATNPTLAPGDYDVTLSSPLLTSYAVGPSAVMNALRELYQIPPHPGIQIEIPSPLEDHIGEEFTVTDTHVLPQLSVHASGGTLTEPHVYGRQGAAEVWGSNTATQEIYDDIVGVNTTYQQVRFYARRFGDTTVPLTLTGTGSLAASTASIAVSDFDLLTPIVDGWREVTLRFGTAPVMGTLASPEPSWTWSATAEDKGNRWEILAACAPAISGIPGNLLNLVTATQRLGTATYQPPAGDTVELTWMPQGVASPYVSGASADPGCDGVLIFSQDPPTVTGVSISQLSQTVTGIGLDCGSLPCCIPSGIAYQRVTWSATSLPVTGFGAYEMQRWDTTPGAQFETIMLASSPTVTGFNDYEARVGLNSVYRIRTLNILNFAGAWSTYVTGAPPTPGVTGGCTDSTGALIFTSNAAQSGAYNAAYTMQWENEPVEDFKLPEAEAVQFQPMYQRDGMVAFHGTERGLEQFNRTLLIQAGAIDPIRLADVKTLRDLAWAQLPYVCVRDEAGDRWFANVRVPTVSARKTRTKYFAQIAVTELTTCPYAVDPS